MILSVCPNPSIDTYAWLNDFQPGATNRIDKIKEYPGGKGIHVAMAIAELGGTSRLLGNWAGKTGEWIQSACQGKGVSTSGIELPGKNRTCYTFRSENPTLRNSELLEPGPEISDKNWKKFRYNFRNSLYETSLVCMSGSWPKKAPVDAYHQLIEIANFQKVKVILDCSGHQLREALASKFFGLHVNEDEAMELCGSAKFSDLLDKLQGKVELVALSKGKKGLCLYYKGETITANVEVDKVLSTVGSGDCLTAGVAFAVENEMEIKEVAAYGVACGAANCLTEELGIFRIADVVQLLPQVKFNIVQNEG